MRMVKRGGLAAAILVLGLVVSTGSPAPAEAAVFNPATGHYYEIVPGDWPAAEAAAVALGGHLVTINDAAEQAWLEATFGTHSRAWIGQNDIASEGTWVWVSGETPGYTNWDGGEPNNHLPNGPSGEDWGEIYLAIWQGDVNHFGKWNDCGPLCVVEDIGIAEYSRTVGGGTVPAPATLILLGLGLAALAGAARSRR